MWVLGTEFCPLQEQLVLVTVDPLSRTRYLILKQRKAEDQRCGVICSGLHVYLQSRAALEERAVRSSFAREICGRLEAQGRTFKNLFIQIERTNS